MKNLKIVAALAGCLILSTADASCLKSLTGTWQLTHTAASRQAPKVAETPPGRFVFREDGTASILLGASFANVKYSCSQFREITLHNYTPSTLVVLFSSFNEMELQDGERILYLTR